MSKILITGGAGYIGSHVAKQLLEKKEDLIIIDNLSTGSEDRINSLKMIYDFQFIKCDLNDLTLLTKVFKENSIDTIMHFAASIVVPESIENPVKYYLNNTVNTTNLINIANKFKVQKFIFSSTAAVYGEPEETLVGVSEDFETKPINPYGMSKLMSEKVIIDNALANEKFKYIIFRYFNVAGADINYQENNLKPRIGQSFPKATHLIKVACETALKKREKIFIFGDDYKTKDGTCIRDYIHVDDLAHAHIEAISYLNKNESDLFNVGYGKGYSVKEVIETIKRVSNSNFEVEIVKKRKGDPGLLISDNAKIKTKMSWKPKYDSLELICRSALEWEKNINHEN